MSRSAADRHETDQRHSEWPRFDGEPERWQDLPLGPLNTRFLIWTTSAFVLIGIAVHLLHESHSQKFTSAFLERARQLQTAGDSNSAAVFFRKYLAISDQDIDVREELGFLLADSAAVASDDSQDSVRTLQFQAYMTLEQVLRSDPERAPARRRVIDLALDLGRYSDANSHLVILSAILPNDASVHSQLGESLEGLQKYDEAAEAYERAIDADPTRFKDYGRLAQLWTVWLNREDDAARLMDELVSQQNQSVETLLIRCRFHLHHGDFDLSADDAKKASKQSPTSREVLVALAELFRLGGDKALADAGVDLEKLHEELETFARQSPDDPELVTALVSLAHRSERDDVALQLLQAALQKNPNDANLRFKRTVVLIRRRQLVEAREELELFRSLSPGEEYAIYLVGLIQMVEHEWLAATRSFEKVRSQLAGNRELAIQVELHLGQCYGELRHIQREEMAYRRAVSLNTHSTAALLGLARVLAKTRKFDEAIKRFQFVADMPGVPIEIARTLLEKNLQLKPDARQWEPVNEALSRVPNNDETLVDVLLIRAKILAVDGQTEQAHLLLERASERSPGELRLWVARYNAYLDTGELDSAKTILDQAEKSFGRRVELLLGRLQYWATVEDIDAAFEVVRAEEASRDLYADTEQEPILSALASAYVELGAYEGAERVLQKLAQRRQDDVSVRRQLVTLALKRGDTVMAAELIEKIHEIEGPDGIYWRLAQASANVARAQRGDVAMLIEARRLVLAVQETLPNSPHISVFLGQIDLLSGREDEAAEQLLLAVDRGEQSVDVVYELVDLLARLDRHSDAEDVLRKMEERREIPLAGAFGELAVSVWMQTGNYKSAMNMADRAVRADPKNSDKWLWLGRLQAVQGQSVKAEECLSTALQLNRNNVAARVALISFLSRNDRSSEAEALVKEVKQLAGDDPIPMTLAACHVALGDVDRAEQEYQAALVANPDRSDLIYRVANFYLSDGKINEATELLERLCATKNNTAPRILILARRALSSLVALSGQYEEFSRATELIDANLELEPANAIDLLAKSKLLQSRPIRSARLEAIRILEHLERKGKLSQRDQFDLARLYLATGQWKLCRQTMVSLIDINKRRYTTQWLAFAVRTSIDHSDLPESDSLCLLWLRELERVEPQTFRTLELQALHHVAQRQVDDALQLIDDRLRQMERDGDTIPLEAISQVASLSASISTRLERSGQPVESEKASAQAEEYYRRLVKRDPSRSVELVRFYQSQGRTEEALASYPQAWDQSGPVEVAAACVALLQQRRTNAEQNEEILRRIEKARGEHPTEQGLLHQNAKAALLVGRYDAAESLFREVIDVLPDQYLAHNDLALLIAFRGGNATEALQLVEQAIEIAGPRAFLLDTRASVYLALNQPAKALRDLTVAIGEDPTPDKFFHLARVHLAMADLKKAEDAFQLATKAKLHIGRLSPLEAPEYRAVADAIYRKN